MQYVRHSSSPCLGGLGHPLYIRRELFSTRILDDVANGLTITQAIDRAFSNFKISSRTIWRWIKLIRGRHLKLDEVFAAICYILP